MMRLTVGTFVVLALAGAVVLINGCGGTASPGPQAGTQDLTLNANGVVEADLIAGAGSNNPNDGTDVGDVLVSNDDDFIMVEIELAAGWVMSGSHVYVGTNPPLKPNGKPLPPGQFPYQESYDPPATEATIPVPNEWPAGTTLKVAVHAVVCPVLDGTSMDSTAAAVLLASYPLQFGLSGTPRGSLTVSLVDDNLVVVFEAASPNLLRQTWLHVGKTLRCDYLSFPNKEDHITAATPDGVPTYTYTIPLASISAAPGDTLFVVAVANMAPPGVTWYYQVFAGDQVLDPVTGGWWCLYYCGGIYFTVTLDGPPPPPPPTGDCETAWTYSRTTTNYNLSPRANPWGWFFDYITE